MNDIVNKFLQDNNFNPSKKMGQNFLINKQVCQDIVDAIDFTNVDLVIEIGPGLGAITDYLVPKAKHFIAIEIDKRLQEHIKNRYPNIEVINEDVLRIDFDELTKNYKNPIIVSNLPYSISSLVVVKFIKSNINHMYCMLQKEMVDRIIAKPSTHEYNGFTVLLNTYADVKKIMNISKNNFNPIPNIDSTFISIIKNNKKYDLEYDKFIKVCFGSKRQTLANNLKNVIDKKELYKHLEAMNLSLTVRAEELSAENFKILYAYIVK
ncbi:MAG: 16S rRNA (adenine(1518)-N(6)/adenine(1519)-N(6))-dimethyltransferase RsmA [Mycoplasmataceae bacterium]|jgi:16S rRNA (adenine1518-N6/adenine1519-N6)-dimethyltransferase|nr:16S rRNA (adenine(1518)-N(6)/adenine(1519)-N(6))-dimethyltransferase RsmA [Mycoplasmataceae bacterium]